MARRYLSTLSPRRRWGIAGSAAGAALALTVGLGNPWTGGFFQGLAVRPGFAHAKTLIALLGVFRWTLSPHASVSAHLVPTASQWAAALVLDLGWPLLILIGARLLAGGLALRRAKLSLVLGVWSVMTLFGAAIGVIVGVVDHGTGLVLDPLVGFVPAGGRTLDRITLEAGAVAVLGAALGWLPGVFAAIGYGVKRGEPAPRTTAPPEPTLDLAGLETLRRTLPERTAPDRALPDAATSKFFGLEGE